MIYFELAKVNENFENLKATLKDIDPSMQSSLYEALLPWEKACNEIQYPKLYTRFTGPEDEFNSWEEIEDYLPLLSIKEIKENVIVLEGEEELTNHFFMLHLAADTETDVTLISEDGVYVPDDHIDTIRYVMNLNYFDYFLTDNSITLRHMMR